MIVAFRSAKGDYIQALPARLDWRSGERGAILWECSTAAVEYA